MQMQSTRTRAAPANYGYHDEFFARDLLQEDVDFFNDADAFTRRSVRDAYPGEYPNELARTGEKVFAEITLEVAADRTFFLFYSYAAVPADTYAGLKAECSRMSWGEDVFWKAHPALDRARAAIDRWPKNLDVAWRLHLDEGGHAMRHKWSRNARRTPAHLKRDDVARAAADDDMPMEALELVQAAVAQGRWKCDSRSDDWAGYAALGALNLNADDPTEVERIRRLLKDWTAAGYLKVVVQKDDHRHDKKYLVVGKRRTAAELVTA